MWAAFCYERIELWHNCMPVFQRNPLKERSASSKIRKSARIAWHLVHVSILRTCASQNQGLWCLSRSKQPVASRHLWGAAEANLLCVLLLKMRSFSNLAFISLINKNVPAHWPLSRNAKDTKESKTGFRVPSVWSIFWPCIKGDIILFVPHDQVNSFIHPYVISSRYQRGPSASRN